MNSNCLEAKGRPRIVQGSATEIELKNNKHLASFILNSMAVDCTLGYKKIIVSFLDECGFLIDSKKGRGSMFRCL